MLPLSMPEMSRETTTTKTRKSQFHKSLKSRMLAKVITTTTPKPKRLSTALLRPTMRNKNKLQPEQQPLSTTTTTTLWGKSLGRGSTLEPRAQPLLQGHPWPQPRPPSLPLDPQSSVPWLLSEPCPVVTTATPAMESPTSSKHWNSTAYHPSLIRHYIV